MKIALVPSDQGGVEQPLCTKIAWHARKRLKEAYGADVETFTNSSGSNDYVGETKEVNAWGADVMVNIHSNADGKSRRVNGILGLVYSERSRAWGQKLCQHLSSTTGLAFEGVKTPAEIGRGSLYVLRASTMPAVIVEIGAWDVPAELAALQARSAELGSKLADAIAYAQDLRVVAPPRPPTPPSPVPVPERASASGYFLGSPQADGTVRFDWDEPLTRGQADLLLERVNLRLLALEARVKALAGN